MSVYRCKTCRAGWRSAPGGLGEGSWSLLPGETCGPCCDNAPMTAERIEADPAYLAGLADGRHGERELVVRWLKGRTYAGVPLTHEATMVERGEHCK